MVADDCNFQYNLWKKLKPGDYIVSAKEIKITTLLGSCVSICLYDPINKIMGMNHYLTSVEHQTGDGQNFSEIGKSGQGAMEQVIKGMLRLGAAYPHLKAKAFGGASVIPVETKHKHNNNWKLTDIADQNVAFAKKYLEQAKIPLISHDLGGTEGRVIYFDSRDFSVHVRKIKKILEERFFNESFISELTG